MSNWDNYTDEEKKAMVDKPNTLTPEEKVKAIQDVRDFIWDFARENSDADIEQPILAMDKILVEAQEKAAPKTTNKGGKDGKNL